MADTKISDLPTDIVTLADGDRFPVADASALTADTFTTALEIKTHGNTAPVFAAGTASANTHPKFTAGTLLTTPEVGAMEFSGESLHFTGEASQRGLVRNTQLIRANALYNLTASTAQQALFPSPNTLTLTPGCYIIEGLINLQDMSATTGNGTFDIRGSGTGSVSSITLNTLGVDGTGTAANQTGSWSNSFATAANMVTSTTSTLLFVHVKGMMTVDVTGTFIPSISLTTAAGAKTVPGSYITFEKIGAASLTNIGNWS